MDKILKELGNQCGNGTVDKKAKGECGVCVLPGRKFSVDLISVVTGGSRCRSSQSPSEEESIPKTQEQPVTLGRRGPKSNQSPLEEEDPGAASHPRRTSPSHFLRPMGSQSPSEEEDPGAASQTQRKMTKEQSVTLRGRGPRSTQTPS
ncbi:hypothetical protein STEG23_018703 [Scotinomys teguina]